MSAPLRLLRLGGIGHASSRLLDLLERKDVARLILVLYTPEVQNLADLYDTARFFGVEEVLSKLQVVSVSHRIRVERMLGRLACRLASQPLVKLSHLRLVRAAKPFLNSVDVVWFGDNDFDWSDQIFVALHPLIAGRLPTLRSYKETRFQQRWEERFTLTHADHLIFPNHGYVPFFDKLYGVKVSNYSTADLDWRYSRTINWVKALNVPKLSESSQKPHVCILSNYVLSDSTTDPRSNSRYYLIPTIESLISHGITVHLHTRRIFPDPKGINQYERLQERSGGAFLIEKPLKLLAGAEGYPTLKRYNAGILHPPTPKSEAALDLFQQINIPNRFYEYQISGVLPLLQKGSSAETESKIKQYEFGIVVEDYAQLHLHLELSASSQPKYVNSYGDFSEVLVHAAQNLR